MGLQKIINSLHLVYDKIAHLIHMRVKNMQGEVYQLVKAQNINSQIHQAAM